MTTTAADLSGSGDTGQVNGGVTQGVTGPLACDPLSTGSLLNGTNGNVTTSATVNNPQNFYIAGWFQTPSATTPTSGAIISFTDGSSHGDRALWVGKSGLLNWETMGASGPQVVQAPVLNWRRSSA